MGRGRAGDSAAGIRAGTEPGGDAGTAALFGKTDHMRGPYAGGGSAVSARIAGAAAVPGHKACEHHHQAGRQSGTDRFGLRVRAGRESRFPCRVSRLRRAGAAGGGRQIDRGLRCIWAGADPEGHAGGWAT